MKHACGNLKRSLGMAGRACIMSQQNSVTT
jgi:hypothetical protein